MTGGIYTIRIQGSLKFYIGRTKNFKTRKSHHLWLLRRGVHHCKHLQNAFNKHGHIEFVEEQEENDKEQRIILEQWWLDKYGPVGLLVNHQMKANPDDMADKPWKPDRKRVAHNKGVPSPLRGKKRDPEIGAKISASKKGKVPSEKQLLALAENRKKIDHSKPKKPMSEETKKKISEAQAGKKRGPYKKSHGQKISAARKGIVFSEEHKTNLKIAAQNRAKGTKR